MFEEAFQTAKECDKIRQDNKEKKSWKPGMKREECFPPYFGVPISIKESILMKGRQTYVGFATKLN
jgi:Asp-tRNA(Asn)/Glu-tRNA(Gln) amidotransferase A subunit family amidase